MLAIVGNAGLKSEDGWRAWSASSSLAKSRGRKAEIKYECGVARLSVAELQIAILNTLLVILLSLIVAMPVGCFLGIVLSRCAIPGRRLAWLALGSQLAVPLYVFAGGWSAGLGLQGWLPALLPGTAESSAAMDPGGINSTLALSGGWLSHWLGTGQSGSIGAAGTNGALLAVAGIHAVAVIPWVALLVAIGCMRIDRSEEEQATLDGGVARVITHVILPKLRPFLLVAALWTVVPIMTEMVVSNLFQVPTVAEQVYLDVSQGTVRPMTYLASFVVCTLPLLLATAMLTWRLPSWRDVNFRIRHFSATDLPLTNRRVMGGCVWGIIVLLVFVPIANLIAKAGWTPYVNDGGETRYGWTWQRFLATAEESVTLFLPEYGWSAGLALLSSAFALVLAGCLFYVTQGGTKRRSGVALLLTAMFAIPGPMVGTLVIWLLNRSTPPVLGWLYDRTLSAPLLAQQFRLLPLAWILVWAIMRGISNGVWEQAKLDGLGIWATIRTVVWPQTRSHWFVAWVLLFVLSLGELSCSILVLPPGVTTVSMRLFEMLHFGMRHQDSGICLVLVLLGWVVSLSLWKTLRER